MTDGKSNAVAVVDLSVDELLTTFDIGGHKFEVECWEAYDEIREIEREHLAKAEHLCLNQACGKRFVMPEDSWGKPPMCIHCGSEKVEQNNRAQWDKIAELVRTKYGAPRCGRTAAMTFYETVLETVGVAKKKNEPEPASPTGTDSTQETGEIVVPSVG